MLNELIKDEKFALVMQENIISLVDYLLEKQIDFAILAKLEHITFEPELPNYIKDTFGDMVLFNLAEYTLSSAYMSGSELRFEAGFGSENFGSLVSVEFLAIVHIIVDDVPVLLNIASPLAKNGELENSMASFLSNPENSKFFKK